MFIIVQPSMGEDGNAFISSSKGGLNRTMQQPRQISCTGGETVLLIQDAAPWCADANVTELQASGKNFCTIISAEIGTTDLGQFKETLISADQPQTFYDNLFPGGVIHPAIVAWVQNGGILSANLTDGGWKSGRWDGNTFIGGLTHVTANLDDNNIANPDHPIITGTLPCPSGNCGQIVDADLDGWSVSSHGYFINLPPGTTVIIDQPDVTGDGIPEPVMIEYPWGVGRVIATMTTTEWRYAGCLGGRLDRKLLSNKIAYQDFLALKPHINSLSSYLGSPGTAVTINGVNFGNTKGVVNFGATTATVTSWADTSIVITVPELPPETYSISVTTGNQTSNALSFLFR